MAKFKIEIDKDECIGCGSCEATCGANFAMKNGKATVKKAAVDDLGCNKQAADNCPVECIKITKG
jgi:ferredoxin